MAGLFHCHEGGDARLAHGVEIVDFRQVYFHQRGGHACIRVGKGFLYTVEQRRNGQYLALI